MANGVSPNQGLSWSTYFVGAASITALVVGALGLGHVGALKDLGTTYSGVILGAGVVIPTAIYIIKNSSCCTSPAPRHQTTHHPVHTQKPRATSYEMPSTVIQNDAQRNAFYEHCKKKVDDMRLNAQQKENLKTLIGNALLETFPKRYLESSITEYTGAKHGQWSKDKANFIRDVFLGSKKVTFNPGD